MKRLHIIHVKSLTDIESKNKEKIFNILEKETLNWAKKAQKDAYKATLKVQKSFKQKSNDKIDNKYFKYLRRLLELKLVQQEDEAYRENRKAPKVDENLANLMNIESLRIPEHLSCSQLDMYKKCPRKWYYRYPLGIAFPKTTALHFGSAVDDALNFYFEEKIEGRIPSRDKVHNVFFEKFAEGYDEVRWGSDDPEKLKKNGPTIIDKYLEQFDRITEPTGVQTEVRVPLENGDGYLLGYIDILEEDAVVDTKTAKKKWATTGRFAKQDEELQPKAYSLWFLETYERMPREFRYQIVTKKKDKDGNAIPETQTISVDIKKYQLETFRRYVQGVWNEIKEKLPQGKKAFPAQAEVGPRPGRGLGCQEPMVLCTKEWCDYGEICAKEGLRVPLRWVKKTKDEPGHHIYEDEKED
jgi:hypothetical protein